MKSHYDVLRYPYITEKGTVMAEQNKYQFIVPLSANKIEIKKAVEAIYNVEVTKVNTTKVKSKLKRVRFHVGPTAERKKAIVTLKDGHAIELV